MGARSAVLTDADPGTGAGRRIDPRLAARRDEVARDQDRRRARRWRAVAAAVTVVAVAFGVSRSAVADVDAVVVTGAGHTPADEIVAASGVAVGSPLVQVDPAGAAARVERLPWVRSAQVNRAWNGTVAIEVTERAPELTLADGQGGWSLLDGEGRVLAAVGSPPADLITVLGLSPAPAGATVDTRVGDAVTVARALSPALRTRVTSVTLNPDRTIELGLRPSGRVRFGSIADVSAKVDTLRVLFGQVDLRDLCRIDVSVPQAPVLTRSASCA